MRTASELYERHLDYLRTLAEDKGLHFADVLAVLVKVESIPLSEIANFARPPKQRIHNLLAEYRAQFYELLANEFAQIIHDDARAHSLNNENVSKALKAVEIRDTNLAAGRLEGVKSRKAIADKKSSSLNKAIDDLFDAPEKPGWRMTGDEIASFLVSHKLDQGYAWSTILRRVKRKVALHRKQEKNRQASQIPNR